MKTPQERAELELREAMQRLARRLPKGWGFTGLVYEFGPPGLPLLFVTSSDATETARALRELADKLEQWRPVS